MKKFIKFDKRKAIRAVKAPITAEKLLWQLQKHPGESFLLNYKGLMSSRYNHEDNDIINYIILAAARDYSQCKSTGDYTLDADFCRLSKKDLDSNKLLTYHNSKVYFLYEEKEASTMRKKEWELNSLNQKARQRKAENI